VEPDEPNRLEELERSHLLSVLELEDDWPSRVDCDGSLWAGVACAGGASLDIYEAEESPGRWRRRPAPHCEVPDDSRSTISNDMLLGIMSCLLHRQDLDGLQGISDYGVENAWVMGDPFPSGIGEVVLKPVNRGYLCRAIDSLGGARGRNCTIGTVYSSPSQDYVYHVQTVGIYLDIMATGGANATQITRMQKNTEARPGDCLLMTTDSLYSGNTEAAADCWLDPDWQPPSYVRPRESYTHAHRVYGLSILIDHLKGE